MIDSGQFEFKIPENLKIVVIDLEKGYQFSGKLWFSLV